MLVCKKHKIASSTKTVGIPLYQYTRFDLVHFWKHIKALRRSIQNRVLIRNVAWITITQSYFHVDYHVFYIHTLKCDSRVCYCWSWQEGNRSAVCVIACDFVAIIRVLSCIALSFSSPLLLIPFNFRKAFQFQKNNCCGYFSSDNEQPYKQPSATITTSQLLNYSTHFR